MTVTLGLTTMDHSAACLFEDGRLIVAIEEERLSRHKNDGRFPVHAIRECLRSAGLGADRIDRVAVYWRPWRVGTRLAGTLGKMAQSPMARRAVWARARLMFGSGGSDDPEEVAGSWSDLFRLRRVLRDAVGPVDARIRFYDHHLCHQLYAETMRDWGACVSLSYDGGGEAASTVLCTVRDGRRQTVSRHLWPNSLGHYYSTFTGFLGFRMLEGEYKMMGLAPYGRPVHRAALEEHVLSLQPGGRYRLNTRLCDYHAAKKGQFDPALTALFGPPRAPDEAPTERHRDMAASVQAQFEAALAHVLTPVREAEPDLRRLVVSGGCALNVSANGRLLADGLFDEIVIPPAPHDAGCAVGAALADLAARGAAAERAPIRSPYLGSGFDDDAIAAVVAGECGEGVARLDGETLVDRVAALLAEGQVVAWFQGRSEFGPRALGARSFLADPRREEIRETLNVKIKKRELFRPFAPSVTEEAASRFFEIDQPSPYMNIVAKVRPEAADRIPAVTHVDGTARVHSVARAANPLYHALIARFGELTGVPVLLNTSFNIQEPIVNTPGEAFATFRASGVDALAVGPFLVTRGDLR